MVGADAQDARESSSETRAYTPEELSVLQVNVRNDGDVIMVAGPDNSETTRDMLAYVGEDITRELSGGFVTGYPREALKKGEPLRPAGVFALILEKKEERAGRGEPPRKFSALTLDVRNARGQQKYRDELAGAVSSILLPKDQPAQ